MKMFSLNYFIVANRNIYALSDETSFHDEDVELKTPLPLAHIDN